MKVGSAKFNGKRFQMCLGINETDTLSFSKPKKKIQDKSPCKL